jgi:hypothetical protein
VTRWNKLGRLCDGGRTPWAVSHAALPVVDSLPAGGHRVYFSARDERGRARIGWAQTDLSAQSRTWRIADSPSIDLGPLGGFADSGVTSSCLVNHAGVKYQFYTGWSLGVSVPFYLNAGLAISEDGGETFQPFSRGPILERNDVDPFLTASPWVLIESGVWRMWYVAGLAWVMSNGKPMHKYHIRYAESRDGLVWARRGIVCIGFKNDGEYAIARPCVVRDRDTYRMWYAYRGDRYRIGYAESSDGVVWRRLDEDAGIDVSPGEWDGDMVEYPVVADVNGRRVMLYNGDDYGKTGIGIAEMVRE